MADITEQQDVAQEISDAISRPSGETFDEVETVSVFIKTFFFAQILKYAWYFAVWHVLTFLFLLGWTVGWTGGARAGGPWRKYDEYGRTAQRSQLQTAFIKIQWARK